MKAKQEDKKEGFKGRLSLKQCKTRIAYLYRIQTIPENTMVSILKKGASKQDLVALKARINKKPALDLRKFCGILKLQEDPLEIQKTLRDEWQ